MKNLISHYFNNLLGYAIFSFAVGIIVGFIRWGMRWISYSRDKEPFTINDMLESMIWTDIILISIVLIIIGINLMMNDSDTKKVLAKIKEELL